MMITESDTQPHRLTRDGVNGLQHCACDSALTLNFVFEQCVALGVRCAVDCVFPACVCDQ